MTNPADSFFGGAAGLSWPKANANHVYEDTRLRGVVRGGLVVDDPKIEIMTEMGTGATIYWDKERTRPKEQMIVTLLCDGSRGGALDERNSPTDDGKRRLYIRGYMVAAVGDALKKVNAPGIRQGGELYVAWIDEKPSNTKGFDPARLWAARYVPPSVPVPQGATAQPQNGLSGAPAADPFAGASQPQTVAAPATQAPATAPPANPFGGPLPAPAPARSGTPATNPFG